MYELSESSISSQSTYSNPLMEKVYMAGCHKEFVGQGARLLSKSDIKKSSLSELVVLVSNRAKHAQVRESATYLLGLYKIYQKKIIFFKEDVKKLHAKLDSVLYNFTKTLRTPKNTRTPKKRPEEIKDLYAAVENLSLEMHEDHAWMMRMDLAMQTDKHLLQEIDIRLPEVDTLGAFGDELHLRIGPSYEPVQGIRIEPLGTAPLISAEATSVVTGNEATSGIAGIQVGAAEGSQSVVGTPKRKSRDGDHEETPSKRQRVEAPPDSAGVARVLFEMDPNLEEDEDYQEGMWQMSTAANTDPAAPEQQNVVIVTEAPQDDIELPVLTAEELAALAPKPRRRKKPVVNAIDLTNVQAYTKKPKSVFDHLKIRKLKNLMSKPSTKQAADGTCLWPKNLQDLYAKNARPVLNPSHVSDVQLMPPPPPPRPLPSRPVVPPYVGSGPTAPGIDPPFDDNLQHGSSCNDAEIIPPPLGSGPTVPGIRVDPPSDDNLQHGSSRNGAQIIPLPIGPRPTIPNIQVDPPSNDNLQHSAPAELPHASAMCLLPSARKKSTFMDQEEFYKLLENKWANNRDEVLLDDLIVPQRSTLRQFHRYFTYLQRLEVNRKLTMEQKQIYGPVYILKTIEEEEEKEKENQSDQET